MFYCFEILPDFVREIYIKKKTQRINGLELYAIENQYWW